MRSTKLILIEGLPGAGKSTTTAYLQSVLRQNGLDCKQYLEEDNPHPIACLEFALAGLPGKVVPLWERFAGQAVLEPGITIIESRLWQNTAMFMYMGGCDVKEIYQFNEQVSQVLMPLRPILFYLDQDNTEEALHRLDTLRGSKWMREALNMTSSYQWFRSRRLNDFSGWVLFFKEWRLIAENLFSDWPGSKVKILNPHVDWVRAYEQMCRHLGVAAESTKSMV
jgi:hypothetical protein